MNNDELKDFWKGFCGFTCYTEPAFPKGKLDIWTAPDGTISVMMPALTLDNLFKWAVPRVKADIPELKWAKLFVDWLQDILYDGKEPVTSLYERIQKVRREKNERFSECSRG